MPCAVGYCGSLVSLSLFFVSLALVFEPLPFLCCKLPRFIDNLSVSLLEGLRLALLVPGFHSGYHFPALLWR